jgi:hypothetical protein
MKWILKIIICFILQLVFMFSLKYLGQYNFVSYMFGLIEMGLYLIVVNVIDD